MEITNVDYSSTLKRMAALRYFLHQDDLKAGDTGSAAQLEAQKEEEEHIKLVQVALSMKD